MEYINDQNLKQVIQSIESGQLSPEDYYRDRARLHALVEGNDFKREGFFILAVSLAAFTLLGPLAGVGAAILFSSLITKKLQRGQEAVNQIEDGKFYDYLPPSEQRTYQAITTAIASEQPDRPQPRVSPKRTAPHPQTPAVDVDNGTPLTPLTPTPQGLQDSEPKPSTKPSTKPPLTPSTTMTPAVDAVDAQPVKDAAVVAPPAVNDSENGSVVGPVDAVDARDNQKPYDFDLLKGMSLTQFKQLYSDRRPTPYPCEMIQPGHANMFVNRRLLNFWKQFGSTKIPHTIWWVFGLTPGGSKGSERKAEYDRCKDYVLKWFQDNVLAPEEDRAIF